MELPFSQACENNKNVILNELKRYIDAPGKLLEMGHGTGQHAIHMAPKLPVTWYASDLPENHQYLEMYLRQYPTENIKSKIPLKAGAAPLHKQLIETFNYIFTANTLHIMSEEQAYAFCNEVAELMQDNGLLFLYGPFKFGGEFTSKSNANFDLSLKSRNSLSGIRDFEELEDRLNESGLELAERIDLPANNQMLVFKLLR